jgi:hypothetical protein
MIRNQFAAEYGRASGGRVNLRTAAVRTTFMAGFYDFYRNDIFNANTFNNKRLDCRARPSKNTIQALRLAADHAAVLQRQDRTHFFAAYEFDTILDSTTIDTLVPIDQNPLFPFARAHQSWMREGLRTLQPRP